MAVAVRIARAATGRDLVLFCGYHGWHDWYLAANLGGNDRLAGQLLPGLEPTGVPSSLAGSSIPFHYNRPDQLETLVSDHGARVAAIVMEPIRYTTPCDGFLQHVRDLASKTGCVLVFDEITSGWRHTLGGAHLAFGVTPDVAVFAKAMGNGHPISAVIGTREIMEAAQSTFISSTYWTERVGYAAALATIQRLIEIDGPSVLDRIGAHVQKIWRRAADHTGLAITIEGRPPLSHFSVTASSLSQKHDPAVATLITQSLLERGILGTTAFYASVAHEPYLETYGSALTESFAEIARSIDTVDDKLRGPVRHTGFARLT